MEFEKFKKILVTICINFACTIVFIIFAFYPYPERPDDFGFDYGVLLFGGWEGLFIILIGTLLTYFYKIRFAVGFQIIGCIAIFYNMLLVFLTLVDVPLVFIIGIGFSLIGFIVNIVLLYKKLSLDKEVAEEKFQIMLKRTSGGVNLKTRLFGMIKVEKQFNLETAHDMLKIPKSEIKDLIYDLVGEGKLEGEFQDDIFLISSDIDDFLTALDSSFQEWEQKVQFKDKKI